MKIAVCGKGGSGKSTVTALLAKELESRGKTILVIDNDESNFGLHRQLGVDLPKDFTEMFGGKKKILPRMLLTMQKYKFVKDEWALSDIPNEYYSENGNIKLMASGKIHEANEGCACAMGNVIEQFIEKLKLKDSETVLVDMEAGVEHFGRGIDNSVDMVIMVVDPSYESFMLSEKVADLCAAIGKRLCYVLNKTDAENEGIMRSSVKNADMIVGTLPMDTNIQKSGMSGQPLKGDNAAVVAIADKLFSLA